VKLPSKPALVLVVLGVLLALFLIRPGATRLKARIANSIGSALQRQVEIGAVHVRLLPRPGFDLEGFIVHDDPSFSAEPVLRAQDVTASLRMTSLLRGHLAISRLSLTEPSLNLVRRSDGRWNIENFLNQTAVVLPAQTSPNRPELGFPYIEADHGRINFKFGSEKKPFALTDATYSFWQDSESTWGMRLKGAPVRTDVNLSDTGQISVSGSWMRSTAADQTPLHFSARWDDAQLGQLSKALTGEDRGWRGTVNVSLNGTGTPAKLGLQAEGSLRDFRRYDISENPPVELRMQCKAIFNAGERSLKEATCQVPMGDRPVEISGAVAHLLGPRSYDLQLTADKLAMASLLAVARHAKKDLPEDLVATGTLEASFSVRTDDSGSLAWRGHGQTSDFHLKSAAGKTELAFDGIPFSLVTSEAKRPEGRRRSHNRSIAKEPDAPNMSIGPFALKLGRPSGVSVQGWVAWQGYSFALRGEAEIQKLLEAARMTGIPSHPVAARGSAKLDLQIAGAWQRFASPLTAGVAELHQVEAELRSASAPLEITAAKLTLTPTEAEVSSITALAAGAHWKGSVKVPRGCSSVDVCQTRFDLHADALSTEALNEWLNPRAPARAWYELSAGRSDKPSPLAGIRAAGTVSADRFSIRGFEAVRVSAKAELNRGRLHLSELRAGVLGGKHTGEWTADFSVKPPAYTGVGAFEGVSLSQLAELMHDPWISGTAKAQYELQLAGWSSAELSSAARGTMNFELRDGELLHISLNSTALPIRHFSGVFAIEHGEIDLQHATLVAPEASYTVSGKASLARKLDLTFSRQDAPAFRVVGTLSDPTVTAVRKSETRAELKP
jgi:hypothetical protein